MASAPAPAGVPVEVAPGARGHQPATAVSNQVGRVVAVRARLVGPPEEQVGAVLEHPPFRVERPDAGVGGVEEPRPGVRGGEQQPVAVADGGAVGLAHQPDVAQAQLPERARSYVADVAIRFEAQAVGEVLIARVEPLAEVVARPRPPAAALEGQAGDVGAREGDADGGRGCVEPAEATAAVMGGAAAGLDDEVESCRRATERSSDVSPLRNRHAGRARSRPRSPTTAAAYGAG